MQANRTPLQVRYDKLGDVLYLATDPARKDVRYREDDNGLLLRVASDGAVVGVTVEDFVYIWSCRAEELARLAADSLHLDIATVSQHVRESCPNAF